MSAKQAKRQRLCSDADTSAGHGTGDDHPEDDTGDTPNNSSTSVGGLESLLYIPIIYDKIMRFLTYKDVHNLSLSCRAIRELSAHEFERRQNGWSSKYLLYAPDNAANAFFQHAKSDTRAVVHVGIRMAQRKLSESMDHMHFRPKIALLLTGNAKRQQHQTWTKWFKRRLPRDCTVLNVLSQEAICGSIDNHVYEINRMDGICGLGYLLLGTQQRGHRGVHVFKSEIDLLKLAYYDNLRNGPIKCILYFSREHFSSELPSTLAKCKEKNGNRSIALGGLVVDSVGSFKENDVYTSRIECAGLVFTGEPSEEMAASTIIEAMTDVQIRNSMVKFRDSIPFDITDRTKNTICFLLSCVEHSPLINDSPDHTASESDIFHTVFPSNVQVFGLLGHGEFGQISGLEEDQTNISYQFSCVMVLMQFPIR